MLPVTFCHALAGVAWRKYVDFRMQKKPNLRIRVVLKFTYPNENRAALSEGWVSTAFAAPASETELLEKVLAAINETVDYHDRDEITSSLVILTWTSSSGKGCSVNFQSKIIPLLL